jgi:hypothetical protein
MIFEGVTAACEVSMEFEIFSVENLDLVHFIEFCKVLDINGLCYIVIFKRAPRASKLISSIFIFIVKVKQKWTACVLRCRPAFFLNVFTYLPVQSNIPKDLNLQQ